MSATKNPPQAIKPLLPPDRSAWETYSAHYEMPLAGATSIFLHGLIIGMLAVGGIAAFLTFNHDSRKPPGMEMVTIEGGGTGFEGPSGEPGLPGAPDAGGRTEHVAPLPDQAPPEQRSTSLLPKETPPELDIPLIDDGLPPADNELAIELVKIAKQADEEVRAAMDLPKTAAVKPRPKQTGSVGTGNPTGQGGGAGIGNKAGSGTGGQKLSEQQKMARRWNFAPKIDDLNRQASKLAEAGFDVAIPDGKKGFNLVVDLKRRPVEMKKDNLEAYRNTPYYWYILDHKMLTPLAREMGLSFVPEYVVMFMPKDRAEKLATAEAEYARTHGRDLAKIRMTTFDFRLQNGAFEPVVTGQK